MNGSGKGSNDNVGGGCAVWTILPQHSSRKTKQKNSLCFGIYGHAVHGTHCRRQYVCNRLIGLLCTQTLSENNKKNIKERTQCTPHIQIAHIRILSWSIQSNLLRNEGELSINKCQSESKLCALRTSSECRTFRIWTGGCIFRIALPVNRQIKDVLSCLWMCVCVCCYVYVFLFLLFVSRFFPCIGRILYCIVHCTCTIRILILNYQNHSEWTRQAISRNKDSMNKEKERKEVRKRERERASTYKFKILAVKTAKLQSDHKEQIQ